MQKQIINSTKEHRITGLEPAEFVVMTNENHITKRMLTMLLKRFTLYIELYNKTMISATYKDFKLLGRTPEDIILVFNELTGEEMEVSIADIRIIRVFK
ncbi:MAG: hypothetical protein N4A64_08915 [Marinisporobacter sp.]|jgi:hypothetical protein|nr:hypothetical protein [Marinisporobacter sp.]